MRLIPVIDLLDGKLVHAVKGDRAKYLPLKTVLWETPDAATIAKAFSNRLRLSEIYVADLNAIQGRSHPGNRDFIVSLVRSEELDVLLDAGISNVEEALEWLDVGIRKIIIGSETLRELSALSQFHLRIPKNRLVFSLDIRSGGVLSRCPELAAMSPMKALGLLSQAGWSEVLILDLDRVGSERGIDRSFAAEAQTRFPHLELLVGGGIANPEQLVELRSSGFAGVLLATALHRGAVTDRHIFTMRNPGRS